MKTELRSEEADCGGVGVFGEVGTEADVSGSVSAILRKVILCGGSLSRGTGWPFRVPEVEVRTGRIPGDFRVYMVFLGWRRNSENSITNTTPFPWLSGQVVKTAAGKSSKNIPTTLSDLI